LKSRASTRTYSGKPPLPFVVIFVSQAVVSNIRPRSRSLVKLHAWIARKLRAFRPRVISGRSPGRPFRRRIGGGLLGHQSLCRHQSLIRPREAMQLCLVSSRDKGRYKIHRRHRSKKLFPLRCSQQEANNADSCTSITLQYIFESR
jgi:hypothetical protein